MKGNVDIRETAFLRCVLDFQNVRTTSVNNKRDCVFEMCFRLLKRANDIRK